MSYYPEEIDVEIHEQRPDDDELTLTYADTEEIEQLIDTDELLHDHAIQMLASQVEGMTTAHGATFPRVVEIQVTHREMGTARYRAVVTEVEVSEKKGAAG